MNIQCIPLPVILIQISIQHPVGCGQFNSNILMNWKCAKFNNPKCVQGKAKTKLLQNLMEFASFSWNLKQKNPEATQQISFLWSMFLIEMMTWTGKTHVWVSFRLVSNFAQEFSPLCFLSEFEMHTRKSKGGFQLYFQKCSALSVNLLHLHLELM